MGFLIFSAVTITLVLMATRLVNFKNPVILNAVNRKTLTKLFDEGKIPGNLPYTERVFEPGQSYILDIPETSASYTLAMREDGGGTLQRVMAKPGGKYGASVSGGEKLEGIFKVEGDEQKTQQWTFNKETSVVIPIAVGSKEGDRIWAIFYNGIELTHS